MSSLGLTGTSTNAPRIRFTCPRVVAVPVIVVEDLHKSYGTNEAVRGLSFHVDAGEVVAVVGPNGAGKTTTVEILEGYRSRSSGQVQVLGADPAEGGAALRQRIGIVLQSSGIDPYLSVAEELRMHAGYYRSPRDVSEVIELVGLQEKRDARVKSLSGGQQRRLDLALGLIGDPELLFLDEPTTGFDPSARRQAWDVVRNLAGLGKTILLTTHYMDEAQALADRVIVIAAGRVVAEGTPATVGGRDQAKARVQFALPTGTQLTDLPVAAGTDGDSVVVETTEPTQLLHTLTGWALERGITLDGLSVTRPSLEDIYLSLIATEEPTEDHV
jgi:ABC-2 type transport system ATP-binding protein